MLLAKRKLLAAIPIDEDDPARTAIELHLSRVEITGRDRLILIPFPFDQTPGEILAHLLINLCKKASFLPDKQKLKHNQAKTRWNQQELPRTLIAEIQRSPYDQNDEYRFAATLWLLF